MASPLPDFDPDFAGPADWAAMYRACGLQVIPCYAPHDVPPGTSWKRPRLAEWADLKETQVSDAGFALWYGPGGSYTDRRQMGIITGPASSNTLVIDLDDHKTPAAGQWWTGLLAVENNGMDPETVEQRTGGGGRQKLFRYPPGWHAPTNRTGIGVDIRGAGGFAVMPPSRHESGRDYDWLPGRAPWEVEIAMAPPWLLEAIEDLVEAHGGDQGGGKPRDRTSSPGTDYDAWGNRQDGREEVMRDTVWRAVLQHYREAPIKPPDALSLVWANEAYEIYERKVTTRPAGLQGDAKREALEKDGRGPSAFLAKWRREMRHWGSPKMRDAAARPSPKEDGQTGPNFTADFTQEKTDPESGKPLPLILTSAEFLAGYSPPAYLIDGIVQRGYLYSLTARTGHGKTAVALYMAQSIARGVAMHGCKVLPGTVLILAGENPDDVRARYFVLGKAYGFDPAAANIRWIAGVKHLPTCMPVIRQEAASIDDLVLVLIDTAAAYFPGSETNSNSEQGAYARLLRELTFLPGKPAAIALSHPVKNAARDNLLPMGGSAFLNEIDGNLTLWSGNEGQTTLHWQGKFRGPEFDPMSFEMVEEHCDTVKDGDGRLLPSVVAKPLSEADVEASEVRSENEEDKLMRAMYGSQAASFSMLAAKLGWKKWTVQRFMRRLAEGKFVEQKRNQKYMLTDKGVEAIGGLKKGRHDD